MIATVCVATLKKQSFKNTCGLLAGGHEETSGERAVWRTVIARRDTLPEIGRIRWTFKNDNLQLIRSQGWKPQRQGRQTSDEGRCVVSSGWSNDSSSKLRCVLERNMDRKWIPEKKAEVRLAHVAPVHVVCWRFVGYFFMVVSLPPHSFLGIPLLLYEPLDLSPQCLQVLLSKRAKLVKVDLFIGTSINVFTYLSYSSCSVGAEHSLHAVTLLLGYHCTTTKHWLSITVNLDILLYPCWLFCMVTSFILRQKATYSHVAIYCVDCVLTRMTTLGSSLFSKYERKKD